MDPYRYPLVILLLMAFCSNGISMGLPEDSFLWEDTWGENSSFKTLQYWAKLTELHKHQICARFLRKALSEVKWDYKLNPDLLYYTKTKFIRIGVHLLCISKSNQEVRYYCYKRIEPYSNEATFDEIFYYGVNPKNRTQSVFKLWPAGGEGKKHFSQE